MRKTALTISTALLAAFLVPALPAAALQPPTALTVATASIKDTNTAYLAKAATSLGGADAATGKLKDGTLWRSHRDGIVVY